MDSMTYRVEFNTKETFSKKVGVGSGIHGASDEQVEELGEMASMSEEVLSDRVDQPASDVWMLLKSSKLGQFMTASLIEAMSHPRQRNPTQETVEAI